MAAAKIPEPLFFQAAESAEFGRFATLHIPAQSITILPCKRSANGNASAFAFWFVCYSGEK